MVRTLLATSVLALSLGAAGLHAQPAPPPVPAAAPAPAAAAQPAANPVDPEAIQALKDMGAHLQSLKRFEVEIDLTAERVLADGQKLQHSATAELQVVRPNKMRVRMSSPRSVRELFYDGKTVTLFTPALKTYSQAEFSDNLGVLVEKLKQRFGIEVPAADLFVWGTPEAPFDAIQSAMFAGQDFVDEVLCNHYAFRQGELDWQIWLSAGANPLPLRLVITNRSDEARPQSVTVFDWKKNPGFKDSTFRFVPPKGASEAKFVPLKTS